MRPRVRVRGSRDPLCEPWRHHSPDPFVDGDHHDRPIQMEFVIRALVGRRRTIIVGTGLTNAPRSAKSIF